MRLLLLLVVLTTSTTTACGDSSSTPMNDAGVDFDGTTPRIDGGGDLDGGGGDGGPPIMGDVEPSRYPLELVSPRAAGTVPSMDEGTPSMPSGHRIFRAHPGIEYDIRAVVIGGSYPYAFSLDDAPDGMTIDARTGEIRWPNPMGTTVTPTITVIDREGTTVSSPWTITISASGFVFLDAERGSDDADGTLERPWRSIAKLRESGAAGQIAYFRGGTYRTTGIPTSGGGTWVRVELDGRTHPVQWIGFPGETPVLDNDYVAGVDNGRLIRLSGSSDHPVYLDGFEITGAYDKGLQFGSGSCDYAVFRRLSIHGIAEAIDGENSAGIMTLSAYDDPSWYVAYQDDDFWDNAPGGIKQYSHAKVLWEDCRFRDSGGGPDLKAHIPRFEVRACSFLDNTGNYCGLFGNMHDAVGVGGGEASGEIRYNLVRCGDSPTRWALDLNQDGMAARIDIYRNTFIGAVRVRNTDSEDGPFHFERNVIVNSSDGTDHITFESVTDPARVTFTDNLTGSPGDGIVDADGSLTDGYASHLGSRGHQH